MNEKAALTKILFTIFFLGLVNKAVTTDQCNGPRQIPIRGKMLKGHIYETRLVRSGYAECLFICREEKVCQSFNFVVNESRCEFNNRTKEACSPEDFVSDPHRLYVKLDVSRVPLGSISELPATSCHEINGNEGKKMDSRKYWMSLSGTIVQVYCNMSTVPEDIDECKSDSHVCHVNANCINTLGSYNCTCRPGYTGNGTNCTGALTSSSILDSLDSKYRAKLNSYLDPVLQSPGRSRFVRCWHAKTNGWASTTFHSNCDGKGPTVTIVQVDSYIFGGYTDKSWGGSCRWVSSSKSFLFSIYNINGYAPVKVNIKSSFYGTAIYTCSDRGPAFGGGHDWWIANNAVSNRDSYTNCGATYPFPPGYSASAVSCQFYAGSYKFTPTDVEVFYQTTFT